MFGHRLPLFQLFGLRVRVHPSWLILAALILWSLDAYFPYAVPGQPDWVYWAMAGAGLVGLAASVLAHEMAHALVGRRFDIPFGGITLFLFGGVAELEEEPADPKGEILMALAGPLLSVAAAGLFYGLFDVMRETAAAPTLAVVDYLGFINLLLAGFNMMPAFPMDGGRVLRGALWTLRGDVVWATRIAATGSSLFGMALMAVGLWQMTLGALAAGTWWIIVGFFVRSAALQACRRQAAGKEAPRRAA